MKTEMVFFEAVPPHPAAVSPAELFAQIETVIKKHVVLSDPVAAALAVNDLPHHAAPTGLGLLFSRHSTKMPRLWRCGQIFASAAKRAIKPA
jgi:hypothetical protein